jgi:hypothetical protein
VLGCCSGSTASCAANDAGLRTHGLICFAPRDDRVDPALYYQVGGERERSRCACSRPAGAFIGIHRAGPDRVQQGRGEKPHHRRAHLW